MLGVPVKRIAKIFIIGLSLTLFGGNVLSLLAFIVFSFRSGNPFPTLILLVTMVCITWMEGHMTLTKGLQSLLHVITLFVVCLSMATTFFIGLGGGLLVGGMFALLTLFVSLVANDASRISTLFDAFLLGMDFRSRTNTISGILLAKMDDNLDIFVTSPNNFPLLLRNIRMRPMLPITLIVGSDLMALLLRSESSDITLRVKGLLDSWNIDLDDATPLLSRAILSLPFFVTDVDSTAYSVVLDTDAIETLLTTPVPGMIIFSLNGGLVVVVPSSHTLGMPVSTFNPIQVVSALSCNDFSRLVVSSV